MLFFTRRKRRKLLATGLAPAQDELLLARAPLYRRVPVPLRPQLHGPTQVLLAEKHFEGCDGLAVTDEMRLVIAVHAALLLLRPGASFYRGLDTILIYPGTFVVRHAREDDSGLVTEDDDELAGESWQRGVVILSWQDVQDDLRRPAQGYNVVLHEFAHQLDDEYGGADGAPLLPAALVAPWAAAFGSAYERHARLLKRRREVLFDADAAEDPAEFFATSVEVFFELPRELKQHYPEVYAVLQQYLQLDPAAW